MSSAPPSNGGIARKLGDVRNPQDVSRMLSRYGAFMVTWSNFEILIEVAIKKALRLSIEEANILLASLGFQAKANILYSLLQLQSGHSSKISAVRHVITLAERNFLVHGTFFRPYGRTVIVRREVKHKYSSKAREITADSMDAHCDKVVQAIVKARAVLQVEEDEIVEYGKWMIVAR